MAYENMTYEFIIQRMINRVKEKYPSLDTREGSIIFNALAPAAVELAIMYTELDNVLNESFVGTASREYLFLACEQAGIDTSTFDASAGVFVGYFDVEVPIGSRWNCGVYNYVVTRFTEVSEGQYWYMFQCETTGNATQWESGTLTPITHIPSGLTEAWLVQCVAEGRDETSDEDIRKIYFERISDETSDGNIAQYKAWCEQIARMTGWPTGEVKVFPAWDGPNTVKVSILTDANRAVHEDHVLDFQREFDPYCNGMGDGIAPIGAKVTVSTATEVPINISAKIRWENNQPNPEKLNEALTNCFAKLAYVRDFVDHYDIANAMLDNGVVSIVDLTVNGSKDVAVVLGEEEIPVLGTTTWTVN